MKKIHQPIRGCLEDALYNGLIPRNPTYKAHIWDKIPPKEEKYDLDDEMTVDILNSMASLEKTAE